MKRYRCWVQGRDPDGGVVVTAATEADARLQAANYYFGDSGASHRRHICAYCEGNAVIHLRAAPSMYSSMFKEELSDDF